MHAITSLIKISSIWNLFLYTTILALPQNNINNVYNSGKSENKSSSPIQSGIPIPLRPPYSFRDSPSNPVPIPITNPHNPSATTKTTANSTTPTGPFPGSSTTHHLADTPYTFHFTFFQPITSTTFIRTVHRAAIDIHVRAHDATDEHVPAHLIPVYAQPGTGYEAWVVPASGDDGATEGAIEGFGGEGEGEDRGEGQGQVTGEMDRELKWETLLALVDVQRAFLVEVQAFAEMTVRIMHERLGLVARGGITSQE